jgi:uncharacterized membrane protein
VAYLAADPGQVVSVVAVGAAAESAGDSAVAEAGSAAVAHRGAGEMNFSRIIRHLCTGERAVQRALPTRAFDRIQDAVHAAEQSTDGQIRVVVEDSLPLGPLLRNRSTRERALEVFSQLHVWDTHSNCGVLIYVLYADRAVEIIADRGVHDRVGAAAWEGICRSMGQSFRAGRFEAGLVEGVDAIGRILGTHFPFSGRRRNELADRPQII